jgi:cytochrome c-type biogenesis protein CcmH
MSRWVLGVGASLALLLASSLAPPAILAQTPAPAAQQPAPYSGDSLDDQALAIENQLQCPVCENVTVAYSSSALAGQMRQVIREKLAQGVTRDQIIQYFVDRYGEGILTQPPKHGLNLLVWLLPLAGLLAGLAVVGTVLWAHTPGPHLHAAASSPEDLSEDDERLLAQALEEL